jgi:hypothetical protein
MFGTEHHSPRWYGIPGNPGAMSKEADYRLNAATMLRFAECAATGAGKTQLLILAEAWLDLADRAHRIAKQRLSACKPDLSSSE